MPSPTPVFLVGFMGSGKSEVGRRVARLLGARFVDLDQRIEESAGASIAELFAGEGEAAFRTREGDALERVCAEASAADASLVVAVGGGLYADAAHRASIARAGGLAVWLDAPLEELERRVLHDGSRPRWGARDELARLFAERADSYAAADLRVDAGAGDADAVAARVVAALQSRGGFVWKSSIP